MFANGFFDVITFLWSTWSIFVSAASIYMDGVILDCWSLPTPRLSKNQTTTKWGGPEAILQQSTTWLRNRVPTKRKPFVACGFLFANLLFSNGLPAFILATVILNDTNVVKLCHCRRSLRTSYTMERPKSNATRIPKAKQHAIWGLVIFEHGSLPGSIAPVTLDYIDVVPSLGW